MDMLTWNRTFTTLVNKIRKNTEYLTVIYYNI